MLQTPDLYSLKGFSLDISFGNKPGRKLFFIPFELIMGELSPDSMPSRDGFQGFLSKIQSKGYFRTPFGPVVQRIE